MANVVDAAVESRAWEYWCPVCGVELAQSNFDTPENDYYCPVCTSRQLPKRFASRHQVVGPHLIRPAVVPASRRKQR
jgi:Zn finger protein HypA/HybF involved in hydrogenase expression